MKLIVFHRDRKCGGRHTTNQNHTMIPARRGVLLGSIPGFPAAKRNRYAGGVCTPTLPAKALERVDGRRRHLEEALSGTPDAIRGSASRAGDAHAGR